MLYLLSIVIGYLFGCAHGSQLVGKLKKVDIKKSGVKNSGASNTTILLGWKYGAVVAFIDILKASLSVVLLSYIVNLYDLTADITILLVYMNVFFVIIGHNYPITMSFKGGKGTASLVGALLVLDWKIAVISIGALLLFTFITDYLIIGVLLMYLSFVVTTFYYFWIAPGFIAFILFVISIVSHKENYKRILVKEETKLSSLFGKKP
ncbi:glycerol-3-phosphate acyltransferase [Virgibacillus sp. DJP39]|uniref:glycerol-3-phosphate acyltransferase n=1 Tax=Virgibacillus sp. DJP39 TaxID=3409790 RepID=UPI003BB6CA1B